ncbi:MAG: RNA 3'-terminal phosphate cyclase [Candidatus Micrarchaeia archaeon]
MVEIDGSYGEGGGQILRTALALASITQKEVKIKKIRANRTPPGLKNQHLTVARAVRKICRGELEGDFLGSTEISFKPGQIVGGKYEFNIGTAGSITLLFQAILPILLYANKPSEVTAIGGTHVKKSPTWEYFENVFLRALNNMGVEAAGKLLAPGYYPEGGGRAILFVKPSIPKKTEFWPAGEHVRAVIRIANLPMHVAVREKKIFFEHGFEDVSIIEDKIPRAGNAVTAWKGLVGGSSVGERGKRAEEVANEALEDILKDNADVDRHLADQLMLYGVLANGIRYRTTEITEHARTNAYIIKMFLENKIKFEGNEVCMGQRPRAKALGLHNV